MHVAIPTLALSLLALAPSAAAQALTVTVGPSPAPIGAPISITLSNDNPGASSTGLCPYQVFDAQGALVFDPTCSPVEPLIGPYGWIVATWEQVDQLGAQVPPGDYVVRVTTVFGPPTDHRVTIGGTDANLVLEGTATIGQTLTGQPRNFSLCAPLDGGFLYVLLASFTTAGGIPSCGGTLPLAPDALFHLSAKPGALFGDSVGVLPPSGVTKAPTFPLPPDPALLGISLSAAFGVVDPAAPCVVRRTSLAYPMTIVD